jgi:hypothetical protein
MDDRPSYATRKPAQCFERVLVTGTAQGAKRDDSHAGIVKVSARGFPPCTAAASGQQRVGDVRASSAR